MHTCGPEPNAVDGASQLPFILEMGTIAESVSIGISKTFEMLSEQSIKQNLRLEDRAEKTVKNALRFEKSSFNSKETKQIYNTKSILMIDKKEKNH